MSIPAPTSVDQSFSSGGGDGLARFLIRRRRHASDTGKIRCAEALLTNG